MRQAIAAAVLVVGMLFNVGEARAQGYCDHFTYPWQGAQADGASGENTSVNVPPGLVYPVDFTYPTGATRVSFISWFHWFPQTDVADGKLELRAFVEKFPHRTGTLRSEGHVKSVDMNRRGFNLPVNRNLSLPMGPGDRYFVWAVNHTENTHQIFLSIYAQICFANQATLDAFRVFQNHDNFPGGVVR